jgi:hypothetical protein
MASVLEVLEQEEAKWRKEPFHRYLGMEDGIYSYEVECQRHTFDIEIHTKKNADSDEIVVMLEVSRKAIVGAYIGKAKYFVINRDNESRDATPDEAF